MDEKEIKFHQLMMRINIAKDQFLESRGKQILLSKGILAIINNKMFFYDYIKFSKILIMKIPKEYGRIIQLGELRNNKFYICSQKETYIYQLNDDLTIKLLNRINTNLFSLQEIDDNVYVGATNGYIYIWKKLRFIPKPNFITLAIFSLIFLFIQDFFLHNLNSVLYYTINILEIIVFSLTYDKIIYLLNPYKKFEICNNNYYVEKCGKYLFLDYSLLDYNNFLKKKINFGNEAQYMEFWDVLVINDDIIIFCYENKTKIYDVNQDKIIKVYTNDFHINYNNTCKVGNNIYYTIDEYYIYKWKYNFEKNKIDILNKKDFTNFDYIEKFKIINDKLYILEYNNFYSLINIHIFQ